VRTWSTLSLREATWLIQNQDKIGQKKKRHSNHQLLMDAAFKITDAKGCRARKSIRGFDNRTADRERIDIFAIRTLLDARRRTGTNSLTASAHDVIVRPVNVSLTGTPVGPEARSTLGNAWRTTAQHGASRTAFEAASLVRLSVTVAADVIRRISSARRTVAPTSAIRRICSFWTRALLRRL